MRLEIADRPDIATESPELRARKSRMDDVSRLQTAETQLWETLGGERFWRERAQTLERALRKMEAELSDARNPPLPIDALQRQAVLLGDQLRGMVSLGQECGTESEVIAAYLDNVKAAVFARCVNGEFLPWVNS